MLRRAGPGMVAALAGFAGWIRITRLSPSRLFWATLPNVYADGRLELLAPAPGMSLETPTLPGGVR
jgi:hypothetical protein